MNNIEDLYSLSPMQEGLLFHSLYSPDSGVYISQHSWALSNLNVSIFVRSWKQVMARHQILRTAFIWKNTPHPLQIVFKQTDLPLRIHDWRHLPEKEQKEELQRYLSVDRRQSFKLNKAPLMRLTLIRLSEDSYQFIWTQHHILVDGWCLPILLKEAVAFYEAFSTDRELDIEPPRPYRDYIAWLQRQDIAKAESFWREALKGFTVATPLPVRRRVVGETGTEASYGEQQIILSRQLTSSLRVMARQQELTLNTLTLGAWALLLSYLSGEADITFGTTVSGRPPELRGVESMVGLFINVLPMRVLVRPELSLLPWLRALQERQSEMRIYEYIALAQVQRWSDVPASHPLFESILSFENYPVDNGVSELGKSLGITSHSYESSNNYPLTLLAIPNEALILRMVYRDPSFAADNIIQMLANIESLLRNFASQPGVKLKEMMEALTESARTQQMLERRKQEDASLKKLKLIEPKPVNLPRRRLVEAAFIDEGRRLPLVLTPALEGVDLIDWAKNNYEYIEKELLTHGAILFRGFGVGSTSHFEQFVATICPELFSNYGDLPRARLGGRIYGSTPFPADKVILFHNEGSHTGQWPLKIWFCCEKAPEEGGETPLVDCRKAYQLIDPKIRERFAKKGLIYVRHYIEGLDVSWQAFFQTSDRVVVETHCKRASIDFEWTANNGLKTRQKCPGVATHPKTGELLFFNQVQLHHPACLGPDVRESLLSLFREGDLPRNVYYGDESRIEDSVIQEIGAVYRHTSSRFSWKEWDILMVDNMLTAHGRNSYKGDRKVVVAMGEMIKR